MRCQYDRDHTNYQSYTRKCSKKKVERLVLLLVLEVANDPEWGAQSFAQPKHKSNQVRLVKDFRNLNKQLKRKLYPMPKTNEMLLKIQDFQYAMSLHLIIGYYHIQISKNASNICTNILLW